MRKSLQLASWLAVAGLAWSIGYVYNVRYGGELSWLRMMYERKMAIADQIQAPKRLLVTGGSGAHYTINATLMEKELGIPVINLGLDGPIGLDVILPSVIDKVRPGDIVLLIPEYLLLLDEDGFGDRSGPFGIAIGRPNLGGVPPKQLAQDTLLLGVPTLRATTKSTLDVIEKGRMTGYYSDPVNSRGDPTVDKQRTGKWWKMNISNSVSKHIEKRIAKFRKEVEAKGATLVLGLPWVYANPNEKTISNVQKTAEKLSEIAPLLYEKDTFNIKADSNLFADTHYHLRPEARNIRSLELVQQIKPIIEAMEKDQPVKKPEKQLPK